MTTTTTPPTKPDAKVQPLGRHIADQSKLINQTINDVHSGKLRSDLSVKLNINTFKVIRGQGQGEEMTSVPYRDYFLVLSAVA